MNDTLETDSNEFDGFDGQGGMVVSSDFARRFERERDEARAEVERLQRQLRLRNEECKILSSNYASKEETK